MSEILIPRIFHQVWINKKHPELPEPFARYRDTWLEKHPGWEYRLWNLENLDFPLVNGKLLEKCHSIVAMADIIRLEVLYHWGGVFVDTDFECYKNIEPLLGEVHFFAGLESLGSLTINNALMGSQKKSKTLEKIIHNFPKKLGYHNPIVELGPIFLHNQVFGNGFRNEVSIFPLKIFYPYSIEERNRGSAYHEILDGAEHFPEAYAAHHWANTWNEERGYSISQNMVRRAKLLSRQALAFLPDHLISSQKRGKSLELSEENLVGTSWESSLVDAQRITFKKGKERLWAGGIRVRLANRRHYKRKIEQGFWKIEGKEILELEFKEYYFLKDSEIIKALYKVSLFEKIMIWELKSFAPKKLLCAMPKTIIWKKRPFFWNSETFSMEKI